MAMFPVDLSLDARRRTRVCGMCFLNGWRRQLDGTVETETVAANASTSAAAAAVVVVVDEDRALFASSMRRREIYHPRFFSPRTYLLDFVPLIQSDPLYLGLPSE